MEATLLLPVHLMVGTGYGLEPDWRARHVPGTGPGRSQGVGYDLSRPEDAARMWGMVDAVGRFGYDGHTGTACTSTGRSAITRRSGSRGAVERPALRIRTPPDMPRSISVS